MKNRTKEASRTSANYPLEANAAPVRMNVVPLRQVEDKKTAPMSLGSSSGESRRMTSLTQERIAERAKALWLASGCVPGRDEQNWREAEAQLRAELKCD
jgi:hypothetical protein